MKPLNTTDIYNAYVANRSGIVNDYHQKVEKFRRSREYLLSNLKDYEKEIATPINELKLKYDLDDIEIKTDNKIITVYLRNVVRLNKLISAYNSKANRLSQIAGIEPNIHAMVLESLNDKLTDAIISGYRFSLGHYLSYIEIRIRSLINKKGKVKKMIDWGASYAYKDEIIANGGTPLKSFYDAKGKIIGNNGGTEWLIYRTQEDFPFFAWYKTQVKVRGKKEFSFVPARDKISKLYELVNSNPSIKQNYFRYAS